MDEKLNVLIRSNQVLTDKIQLAIDTSTKLEDARIRAELNTEKLLWNVITGLMIIICITLVTCCLVIGSMLKFQTNALNKIYDYQYTGPNVTQQLNVDKIGDFSK